MREKEIKSKKEETAVERAVSVSQPSVKQGSNKCTKSAVSFLEGDGRDTRTLVCALAIEKSREKKRWDVKPPPARSRDVPLAYAATPFAPSHIPTPTPAAVPQPLFVPPVGFGKLVHRRETRRQRQHGRETSMFSGQPGRALLPPDHNLTHDR